MNNFKTIAPAAGETISWMGYEWLTRERWGSVHPSKPLWWYDPSALQIDNNGFMHLKTHRNPKFFPEINRESPIGAGLISCTHQFMYGRFEIEARLPSGNFLWPAFWFYSWNSWPPEVDIVEAYSNQKGSYCDFKISKPFNWWKVETNFHILENDKPKNLGSDRPNLGFKNPADRYIKFSCLWTPQKIEIFYDGKSVRKLEGNMMGQFQVPMNVLINNGIRNNAPVGSGININSDFVVKSFKYTPL